MTDIETQFPIGTRVMVEGYDDYGGGAWCFDGHVGVVIAYRNGYAEVELDDDPTPEAAKELARLLGVEPGFLAEAGELVKL